MTTCATDAPHRPPADWGRAADGLQLAGIALFLLANTTGVLPWSFWLDALSLWPVLIMSAGIKLAFEKSRAPWLLLLGPALVLGSLLWTASGARDELPAGPWRSETQPRPADVDRLRLTANLAGSQLAVTARDLDPSLLVDARSVARPENAKLEVTADQGRGELRINGGWPHGVMVPRKQRWELAVPATLPVALDVRGAFVRSRVDLSRGRIDDGRIDGVFLGTQLQLPAPERPTRLLLNGVFNALDLVVPQGVPVRVEGPGFPFNAVDRGATGDSSKPGYQLTVSGIFSAVTVHSVPAELVREPSATAPQPSTRPKAEAEPTPAAR